ncbi:ribokinase [Micromonospora sp. NPDC050200]|uniref:ribokinase n=1 Tax=Micromonospora sp. NPDC050200 TaxID=3155664 RepID=UPI0033BFFB26
MNDPVTAEPGRIRVIGSLNVDLTLRVATLPVPGETILTSGRAQAFGGKGGNQAVAVATLGGDVELIGVVGGDADGRRYLDNLRQRRVQVSGVEVKGAAETGVAIVLVDKTGENLIAVHPGANAALDPGWVRDQVRERHASVTIAQLEVPVEALEAAATALPTSETFVLNPAPMVATPTVLAGLLSRADILVPNRKELGQLAGLSEPTSLIEVDRCVERLAFTGTIVVTLGGEGAVVYEPDQPRRHHPAPTVKPVDTSGAGDAFCGALAVALAHGSGLDEAVAWSVEVASRSTLVAGAQLPPDFAAPALPVKSAT